MPLLSLPNELLLQVLSHVRDRKTLISLASTCRSLQRLSEAFLYSSVVFTQRAEVQKLIDATKLDPQRLRYVRNYELRFSVGEHEGGTDELLDITTMTSLRRFATESPLCQPWSDRDFLKQWRNDMTYYLETFKKASLLEEGLSPRPLGQLRSLTMHWTGWREDYHQRFWLETEVCPIFLMPTLESLDISCGVIMRQDGRIPKPQTLVYDSDASDDGHVLPRLVAKTTVDEPASTIPIIDIEKFKHTTNLKSLTLTETVISVAALAAILSFPKALERLTILEPARGSMNIQYPVTLGFALNDMDAFNAAIAQQSKSLRSLYVSRRRFLISLQPTLKLDLSDFRVLSSLRLHPAQTHGRQQDSHWELADPPPPALDNLHMQGLQLHTITSGGASQVMSRMRVYQLVRNAASRGVQFTLDCSTAQNETGYGTWNMPVRDRVGCLEQAFFGGDPPALPKTKPNGTDNATTSGEGGEDATFSGSSIIEPRSFPRLRVMTSKYVNFIPPFLHTELIPPNTVRYDAWCADRFLASPYLVENGQLEAEAEDKELVDEMMLAAFAS
ncbi:hypothetical protein TWF694_009518 [Orbilia ellipsospora]|uniref:F-box domain-containing protein n=1 Tax=Orbilia ellipsospora TaxID=2528407 RepID=A0AAV9XHH0_9PEZI